MVFPVEIDRPQVLLHYVEVIKVNGVYITLPNSLGFFTIIDALIEKDMLQRRCKRKGYEISFTIEVSSDRLP